MATMPTTQRDTAAASPGSLITRDGQIQWAGLLFGPGTPYQIDSTGLTGWDDLPGLESADVPRPDQHGSWPGTQWAKPRTVSATVWLLPESPERAHDVSREFRAATGLYGQERWLAVRLHGETLACRARVDRRVVPQDRTYQTLGAAKATLQWLSTDPRRYDAVERSVRTGLPVPEPGLVWDGADRTGGAEGLRWPLDWGASDTSRSGTVTVHNFGGAPANPVVEFRGPVRLPSLTRVSDGAMLQYDIALGVSDVLRVDTMAGTVTLNGTTSRIHTATASAIPEQRFELEPGTTSLAFRCAPGQADPRASVTVTWRAAHW